MHRISCFFIGNSDASPEIVPALEKEIEYHITHYGVTDFIVGAYGNFDRYAANAVIHLKQHYTQVALTLLLPYHPAERPIGTPKDFDATYYPSNMETVPRRLAIIRANQYVIDHVDFLIAHIRYSFGNSGKLTQYAQNREKRGLITVTVL